MRKILPATLAIVFAVAVLSAVYHPWAWLFALGLHPYPASSGTPWTYQLWSGFMPALTVLTLFGSAASLWRVHNCHSEGCWRLGRHRYGGSPWCDKHAEHARIAEEVDMAAVARRLDKIIELMSKPR